MPASSGSRLILLRDNFHTQGMKHPFERLNTARIRTIYWSFLLLTALVPVGMGELAKYAPAGAPVDAPRRTVPTIQFEFANTPQKWDALAAEVGDAGLNALRRQTYLDMLFAVSYSTAIAAGAAGVSRGARSRVVLLSAPWVVWGAWLAGALDVVENSGLLMSIAGPVSPVCLQVTAACATVKFALVGVGILFVFIMLPLPWRDEPR